MGVPEKVCSRPNPHPPGGCRPPFPRTIEPFLQQISQTCPFKNPRYLNPPQTSAANPRKKGVESFSPNPRGLWAVPPSFIIGGASRKKAPFPPCLRNPQFFFFSPVFGLHYSPPPGLTNPKRVALPIFCVWECPGANPPTMESFSHQFPKPQKIYVPQPPTKFG